MPLTNLERDMMIGSIKTEATLLYQHRDDFRNDTILSQMGVDTDLEMIRELLRTLNGLRDSVQQEKK